MERQYIFFRTGRALLVVAAGILAIIASSELLPLVAPTEPRVTISVVIFLAVALIIGSFKLDARFWRKPKR